MSDTEGREGVVDWEAKPEPWRSIGLGFRSELAAI